MRRILLSIAALASTVMGWAVTVNNVAGSLGRNITDKDITSLTITGTLDARDFGFISRELDKLTSIDLSQATIVAYQGNVNSLGKQSEWEANAIPATAFFGKSLTSVKLPQSVTTIGYAAFAGCKQLQRLSCTMASTALAPMHSAALASARQTAWTATRLGKGIYKNCPELTGAW